MSISPVPEQIKTAASETVDAAVAPGQIGRTDSKGHSHYVNNRSQQQQKQKYTSAQNTFTYKIGTFVVMRIVKRNQ